VTSGPSGIVRVALLVLAIGAAVAPAPPEVIERWYSTGVYPFLQRALTTVTNLVPIALLDLTVAVVAAVAAVRVARAMRRRGVRRALPGALAALVSFAAVLYLLFLGVWGLNYRRLPLEKKLDYDSARLTGARALEFASAAVSSMNLGHAPAHAQASTSTDSLARDFEQVQRDLGATTTAVPGVPKRSVLNWYFPRAGIDGMTNPFFLEVIVNPEVLPYERPFVVAHEWAHLAGYAVESEANFLAWLTCTRGDSMARYSGALAAYQHALAAIPQESRAQLPALGDGPRADLRAMADRYRRTTRVVRLAAHELNDRYLRANRVSEGTASYGAVLRLMLGTTLDREGSPRRRETFN